MAKQRLDTLLTERGLFPSRSRAAASVMAGEVLVGHARRLAQKPGELLDPAETLSVAERAPFVSRGGIKLANALAASGVEVAGRRALDVGASTGGFTDCLLQRGASEVIAVDVGYGALDYRLRTDPRVLVLERTNARALAPQLILQAAAAGPGGPGAAGDGGLHPSLPDLAVIDVSFISLSKVLGPVLGCLQVDHDVLALVKPQFEVGRQNVGKGGVVRDRAARRSALVSVGEAAVTLGQVVLGYHPSGLPGPKGNLETFVHLAGRDSVRAGAVGREELEQLALAAEP